MIFLRAILAALCACFVLAVVDEAALLHIHALAYWCCFWLFGLLALVDALWMEEG